MATVNAVLLLAAWGVICALIAVLYRIARFYQITSGRRSLYRWFLVPLILLAAAAVINVLVAGGPNLAGDVLLLAGAGSLIGLGYNLLRLMTGSRS
jgi:drug/metabolite transporter (DMT)-like permease